MLDGIKSIRKIFADDTSLFFIANHDKQLQSTTNKDLESIGKWAHQWKILFNFDSSKQATEMHFSRKHGLILHLPITSKKRSTNKCCSKKFRSVFKQ